MSLIYGPAYRKGYSITGNTLVVLNDSILQIIVPLRNIIYKNVPMITHSLGCTRYPIYLYSPNSTIHRSTPP